MTSLQILIGLIINKVEEVHDYTQIVFSDYTTLNIYNNYSCDSGSVLSVEGKTVKSVDEKNSRIIITLTDDSCLIIGMENHDYNGPEAIVLHREGKATVVWD